MTLAKSKLKDIVIEGLLNDVFLLKEALSLEEVISNNADEISHANFGKFFGTTQRHLISVIYLYAARIFEKRNDQFPVKSIPTAFYILRNSVNDICIEQRHHIENYFEGISLEQDIDALSDKELTLYMVEHFRDKIKGYINDPSSDLEIALNKVKNIRDKSVAHNEDIEAEELSGVSFEQLHEITKLAEDFVNLISDAYFTTASDSLLDYDTQKSSFSLEKLLKKLDAIGTYKFTQLL